MKNRTGTLAYMAIAGCLGIAVSRSDHQWGLLLLFIIYLCWFYFFKRELRKSFWLILLSGIAFYIYMAIVDNANITVYSEDTSLIFGAITTPVDRDGNKLSFEIKSSENEKVLVEYFMQYKEEDYTMLELGATCEWIGVMKKPIPPTNPHAFNYPKFLYEQQIHWVFSLEKLPSSCDRLKKKSILMHLQQFRTDGIAKIAQNTDPQVGSFMISLIYGDRSLIESDLLDTYQVLGIVHLLAISGLHVGIVSAGVFYIGIRAGFARQKVNLLLLMLLPVYVVLTGAAPSVLRAAIMTGMFLLLMLYKKRSLSIDTIGFACLLVLIMNPYYLAHIGFQLSFSVSLSLLLSSQKITQIKNNGVQILFVSFIAQIASIPILLFHFYQVSIWSPFLNLLFVPFYSLFVLPASFALYVLLLIHPFLLQTFLPLLSFPLEWMNNFAVWVDRWPFGTLIFPKPPKWFLLFYMGILFLFFYWLEKGRWLIGMLVLTCFMLLHYNLAILNPYGKMVVLDIGQGDAILIQMPFNKETYLIDTGGYFSFPQEEWMKRKRDYNSGDSVLVPFLKAHGIRKLDKLILTHGDYDHIGNVERLWGRINVKQLLVPIGFGASDLEDAILMEAKKRNVDVKVAKPNEGWGNKWSTFVILHPEKYYENKNDGSIVMYAVIGGVRWLFTGDLESQGELDLIRSYPELKVDVLKAGHHGSSTSSTEPFLEAIQPSISIISAGRNNRFGHPRQDVLDRMEEVGSLIYRTDTQGAIIFEFTQSQGTFSTVIP